MDTLTIDIALLAMIFAMVAFFYASVGLGGGSSYTALLAIFGASTVAIPMVRVQLTGNLHDGYSITLIEKQGSHMLTSLTEANGYVILEPGQTIAAGERCDVYLYDFTQEPC